MKKLLLTALTSIFLGFVLPAQSLFSELRVNELNNFLQLNNDSIFPPTNLQAQVLENDVLLTWLPSADGPGEWLTYADSALFTLVGLTEGGTWRIAARWEPNQIEQFDDEFLSKVEFIPGSDAAEYMLKIWKGAFAETLIYEQEIVNFTILEWNKIMLDNPVQIDASEELWVGIEINQSAEEYPIGNDAGPAVQWYGDLISFDTDEWASAADFGLDYNWTLRAFITQSNGPVANFMELSRGKNTSSSSSFPDAYNVYRNGDLLTEAPITDLQYTDGEVEDGIFTYGVTAIYDSIESDPVTIDVQVGGPQLLIDPDSLTVVIESGDSVIQQIQMFNTSNEILAWSINGAVDWITYESTEGEILPGDSSVFNLTINSSGLTAGFYSSITEFEINNLSNPDRFLYLDLIVTGDPEIMLNPDTLDFGNVLVETSSSLLFMLQNTGADDLFVTSIESSNESFFVYDEAYYLTPGESVFINVEFLPVDLDEYNGTLTISSNDPDQPEATIVLMGTGSLAPPLNLQASLEEQVVELSWLDPTGGPGTWLYYGTGVNSTAIGITEGALWNIAARWDATQLTDYAGEYITKSRLYYFIGQSDYTLKIWANDSLPELVYEQFIGQPDTTSWNEIILDEPFLIDGETDLLIGYEINQEANSFPAGVDAGPSIYTYGDLVSFDGVNWDYLSDFGLDYNWSIQAFITGEEGFVQIPNSSTERNQAENFQFQLAIADEKISNNKMRSTSEFLGYNIYRDGNMLNEEIYTENSFTDTLTDAGTYSYTVTAIYDEGESPEAGPVFINIDSVELLLPQNWHMTETNIEHQILIPASISLYDDNVLLAGDYVGVFFTHDEQLILAGMTYWDGSDTDLIAFGDHNLTPLKDGFHTGDSLVWVIYRSSDEKEHFVEAVYDQSMPDFDGSFNENGQSAIKGLVLNTLSISEEVFNELIIAPNPVDGVLTISGLPINSTLKVFSFEGRKIMEINNLEQSNNIDLSGYQSGFYLLFIENGINRTVKRIIVK